MTENSHFPIQHRVVRPGEHDARAADLQDLLNGLMAGSVAAESINWTDGVERLDALYQEAVGSIQKSGWRVEVIGTFGAAPSPGVL